MRKIDKHKGPDEKAGKTISFDKVILERLEIRARKEGKTVSELVNLLCKCVVDEKTFFTEMARYHNKEMQRFLALKNELEKFGDVK